MLVNTLNPVLFSFGFVTIYWYGLLYALGVFAAYYYGTHLIKHGRFSMTLKDFDNAYFWIVVSMVVGARLFEVLFYQPSYYFANPLDILAVWKGGLSFHGGFIGCILSVWYFSRKHNLSFWQFTDVLIVPGALAQAFGRLGNLFNQELVGRAFNGAWAMIYTAVDEVPRHPVQLYEIFYNLVIFAVLLFLSKKKLPHGTLFALFFIMYGACRFVVEYFKEPEVMWGFLTIGQWLSVAMVGVGIVLWLKIRKNQVRQ